MKMIKLFPMLGKKTSDERSSVNTGQVHFLSEGGLYAPSEEFWRALQKWEEVFLEVYGEDDIDKEYDPIKRLADLVLRRHPGAEEKVVKKWASVRFFIRLKYLNAKLNVNQQSLQARGMRKSMHHTF